MSSRPLLLEGHVVSGDVEADRRVSELRRNIRGLEDELATLREALQKSERSRARLKKQLGPLYGALRELFGELDDIADLSDAPQSQEQPDRVKNVWQMWKGKVGACGAKIIDALLTHNDMNTQQLAIATGLHRTTIPAGIYALNKAGLLNKSGGRFSLKTL